MKIVAINEIALALLCNSPVDLLIDSRRMLLVFGNSVIQLLNCSVITDALRMKHRLRKCVSFSDFLDAYDRLYMFRDNSIEYFGIRWRCNFSIDEVLQHSDNRAILEHIFATMTLEGNTRHYLSRLSYDVELVDRFTPTDFGPRNMEHLRNSTILDAVRNKYDITQYEHGEWLETLIKWVECTEFDGSDELVKKYNVKVDITSDEWMFCDLHEFHRIVTPPIRLLTKLHNVTPEMIQGLKVSIEELQSSPEFIDRLFHFSHFFCHLQLFRWLYNEGFDLTVIKPNYCTLIILTENHITCPFKEEDIQGVDPRISELFKQKLALITR